MPIWPPGRNDRPSKSSKLLFRFSLGTAGPFNVGDAMPAGQMELVGPPGTVIPTRCYHLVEPLAQCSDHSFVPNSEDPSGHPLWLHLQRNAARGAPSPSLALTTAGG